MKNCKCEDWQNSFHQIKDAQINAHQHGIRYTGEIFRFCPWCSKTLEEIETEIITIDGLMRGAAK